MKALIYREKQLTAVTGLSRFARETEMKAGRFPRPVPLSARARGWLVSEIEQWIEARKAERDAA